MFGKDDNFFKGFKLNSTDFFNGFVPLKPVTYCIVIIYDNDKRKEIYDVENPWQFINGIKKNPRVKNAYIKDEQ